MTKLHTFAIPILFHAGLLGQLSLAPKFETASITLNRSSSRAYSAKVGAKPGEPITLVFQNVSLKYCIQQAYSVKEYQVSGPAWIKSARYDITATLPPGALPDRVWPALRCLLAERLSLATRAEKKDLPIYELTVGDTGATLRASASVRSMPLEFQPGDTGGNALRSGGHTSNTIRLDHASLADFCGVLSRNTKRPVVDATGISGSFDFDVELASASSVSKVLRRQLGLQLEPKTGPVDIVIIESAVRTPTPGR